MPQICKYQNSLHSNDDLQIPENPQHHYLYEKICLLFYLLWRIKWKYSTVEWQMRTKVISYPLNTSASNNTQNIKARRLMRLLLATAKPKQIKQVTVTWNVVCKLHCSCRMDRYRTSKPVTEFRNKSHSNARIISNLRPAPHLNPWHKTADNSLFWEMTVKCFHLLLVRRTISRQVNNTFFG